MIRPWFAGLLLAVSGCAVDPGNCCDSFSPADDRGIYCLAHRDAVVRFVRLSKDPAERRARLDWIISFLKPLESLEDSDALDAAIAPTEQSKPEFWAQYAKQHFWAGRDTNLSLKTRGDLMKCGFRTGIHAMENDLGSGS
ncbi:MAG TPA: hypothetical protein VM222_02875 [Planctomycetota bacterium]|nr:hypothetical protein [Planctomycetota bacterium]